ERKRLLPVGRRHCAETLNRRGRGGLRCAKRRAHVIRRAFCRSFEGPRAACTRQQRQQNRATEAYRSLNRRHRLIFALQFHCRKCQAEYHTRSHQIMGLAMAPSWNYVVFSFVRPIERYVLLSYLTSPSRERCGETAPIVNAINAKIFSCNPGLIAVSSTCSTSRFQSFKRPWRVRILSHWRGPSHPPARSVPSPARCSARTTSATPSINSARPCLVLLTSTSPVTPWNRPAPLYSIAG